MISKKIFIILAIFFCISNIFSATYEIGAENLIPRKYTNSAKDSFGLNGKNMQIKTPDSSFYTVWLGHNIKPSDNVITFEAKTLTAGKVNFITSIRMIAYHADNKDMCKGKSKTKIFELREHTAKKMKIFHMPFTITPIDLRCEQCGKSLDHANFIFYFGTEKNNGIEVSPFKLQVPFNVTLERKKDEQSPHLSNILSPNYKPYEMKKLPDHTMFTEDTRVMSQKANATRAQYNSFIRVLDLWQKKDYNNAVIHAEKIAGNNIFSSIFLYLLYSRGYGNFNIDNKKAAKYFSTFIGSYFDKEPGFMFYLDEYKNIWKKYRLIPTIKNEKVIIKAWGNNNLIMDEIVPLRGTYQLKNCYEERMHNIGGIGARVLYLIGREQIALRLLLEESRRLGNAEAWVADHTPYLPDRGSLAKESINKPSDIEFQNLYHAAKLGFVPAKLKLARVLVTKNFSPSGFDFAAARKLLIEAIAECEKYSSTNCRHADSDLQYAKDLLAIIPHENTPTAELVKRHDMLQQKKAKGIDLHFLDFQINIIAEMIAAKNDDPDSLFQQALKLPNSQYKQKNQMIRNAAEKGSHNAIRMCLGQIFSRGHREHWYFLYLAGKYKMPYNGNQQNYFNESYLILRQLRYQMPPPEYIKSLSYLAPFHKQANAEYKMMSRKLEFDFIISDNAAITAKNISNNGMNMVNIKAEPSEQTGYITIKNRSSENIKGSFFFYTNSQQSGNLHVFGEFKDSNGRLQKTYNGNTPMTKFIPQEIKITIAPRSTPLDLQIRFMLY